MADDGTKGVDQSVLDIGDGSYSSIDPEVFAKEFMPEGFTTEEPEANAEEGADDGSDDAEDLENRDVENPDLDDESLADEGEEDGDDAAEEGDADEPSPTEAARKPVTQFSAKDADGDALDTSDVNITFTANGKERTLPLDRVVRLAQTGFYNETLQAEVKEFRTEKADLIAQAEELQEIAEQRTALVRKLLEDDDFLLAQRERYLAANSPDKRAERAEAKLREVQQEREQQQFEDQRKQFVSQEFYPKLQAIVKQYPNLSEEEVWGRFNIASSHLTDRSGHIPPKLWRAALKVIDDDIGPWAAQRHEARLEAPKKERAQLKAEARRAQEKATEVKRKLTKNLRPSGVSAATSVQKRKPIVSADDAVDDIIANDVSAVIKQMLG
jgi:hypothetical protein